MNGKNDCVQLIEEIIDGISSLPKGPFWVRHVVLEKRYQFPISLDVGNGKEIDITPEINNMIARFSTSIMNVYFQSHKSEFTNSEWDRMARRALGSAFVKHETETNIEQRARATLETTKQTLRDWIGGIVECEYVFGCHFCNVPDLEPLSVGPVRFEPKLEWLKKLCREGDLSNVARSRIERTWRGEQLRKRRPSEDEEFETRILSTICNCDFVCSVKIGIMGSEAGLQKALNGSRLATTAIALAWNKPSETLERIFLTFDRQPYLQQNLIVAPGRFPGWRTAWSNLPNGVTWLNHEDWNQLTWDYRKILGCAGEAIRYVTHGNDNASRPKVMNVLSQALLWFHEGCREDLDVMAIVKFWSAMEALTCGRKEQGVLDLMDLRLKITDKDKLRKDIKSIYRYGRSRTVHGTNSQLGHDWTEVRSRAEKLAQMCLLSCLHWANEHRKEDNPKLFLQS